MSQARRKSSQPQTVPLAQRLRWPLGLALGLALVIGGGFIAQQWLAEFEGPAFETLVIKGERRQLSPDHIRAQVKPALESGYFGADLSGLRQNLEAEPWVASVSVRRQWPSTLELTVREQVPVAIWNRQGFLNHSGDFFVPREIHEEPGFLPELNGPEGSESEVLDRYRDFQEQLDRIGLVAETVTLSERRAWQMGLMEGPTLYLGRQDGERRFTRFVSVAYPALKQAGRFQLDDLDYIDMRYTNGFSLAPKVASGASETEDAGNG
ncbi:cell division protein FtsQ [Natronospira proteinivora]|uniref:Cell division protein FtsQ n=1 Tax=Natronospira proteinivora TaxID=1807133 RepID=A0ABT1G480_9GAMM|nr:FtsQ-type POTRA domain-containing protein [Natronospira proteinivora]MCP1726109.1 cell division protein FtsQ [Natronospira proteinivora]